MAQRVGNMGKGSLNIGSRVRVHPDSRPKVTFDDVAGYEDVQTGTARNGRFPERPEPDQGTWRTQPFTTYPTREPVMPQSQFEEILERIQNLHVQLEEEFDHLLAEKQGQFRYSLEKGKVVFEQGVRKFQQSHRTGIWKYLREAKLGHILIAPIIYSVMPPLLLLDFAVTFYQHTCFRVYGIPRVRRADYIIIDRQHLGYLNAIEKLNCMYCGYGNGLMEYSREIIARTEQYWCPIKHAHRALSHHDRMRYFADYGDAEAYQKKLEQLRKALAEK